MFENSIVSENESIPSDEYLLEEIAKIKEELIHLRDLKGKTSQSPKPKRKPVKRRASVKRRTATKRKPVKRRASVKRRTASKRKPVKRRTSVKRRANLRK